MVVVTNTVASCKKWRAVHRGQVARGRIDFESGDSRRPGSSKDVVPAPIRSERNEKTGEAYGDPASGISSPLTPIE
jgi:hypothetical protein